MKELLDGKKPKAVVEEEHKVSTADQLYREQVEEYNVSCELQLFLSNLSINFHISRAALLQKYNLKMLIHAHFFRRAILTHKVGHTDLFLVCDQGSLVGLCVQDYKSLCAAVTIFSTLANIQTHINTHSQTAL